MSTKISRRSFLKCTGASIAAVSAAGMLGGCKSNGNSTVVEVKVGDKVSNWNNLGVQLTSLFKLTSDPAQAGYEYIGVLVTAVKCLIQYVRGREHVRIELAEGISLALLFKMGGEVLRTVIVRTWDELAILGAIIVIRGALTFLLHWEIRTEKAELDAKKS